MSPLRAWLLFVVLACPAFAQTAAQYELIQATGQPAIYLLENGKKHHIQTPNWLGRNGFGGAPIHQITSDELDAIPESYPLPDGAGLPNKDSAAALDGKLIRGNDGRMYAVYQGKRHFILDSRWIEAGPYKNEPPIQLNDRQMEEIPVGGSLAYHTSATKALLALLTLALIAFFVFAPRLKGSTALRAAAAVISIAAIGLREPYLLTEPRFWAEEGLVWFQYGATHSILKTLFWVYPYSSYYNLSTDLGAVLSSRVAAHFGLLYAPIATTLLGYAIQSATVLSILFVKSRLFDSFWKAFAGCLIMLFASTTQDEIWLNTTSAMSFLGAIAVVLLFAESDGWSRWKRCVARGALVFCALSSPYAIALFPLFLFTAWHYKGREQRIQCLILLVCVVIQLTSVVTYRRQLKRQHADPMRVANIVRPDAVAVNMFAEHMLYPAVGFSAREKVLELTGLKEPQFSATSLPPRPLERTLRLGGMLSALLILGTLYLLRGPTLFSVTNQVMAAFLIQSLFTCLTAIYAVPTGRYAFLPGMLFLLLLLLKIDTAQFPWQRYATMALLSLGLASGMLSYATPQFQMGPSWPGEIKKWEADPNYTLRVWPSFFVNQVNIVYPRPAKTAPLAKPAASGSQR